jgi:predicted DNA-binding antitoxin AbrB/MazE fold protein
LFRKFGLDFVHWVEISTDLAEIDAQRDADSVQAIKNGCGAGHHREGIVLRPLMEVTLNNGERVICKHKRDEFGETKTPIPVNKEKQKRWRTRRRLLRNG